MVQQSVRPTALVTGAGTGTGTGTGTNTTASVPVASLPGTTYGTTASNKNSHKIFSHSLKLLYPIKQ